MIGALVGVRWRWRRSLPRSIRRLGNCVAIVPTALVLWSCSKELSTHDPLPTAADEDRAFIARLGLDTIFVERFTRRGRDVEGDIINRSPTTTVTHYQFTADESGALTRLSATTRDPNGGPDSRPLWSLRAEGVRGGLDVTMQDGADERRRFVAGAASALPVFDRSVALYELATRRLRAARADSLVVPVIELDSIAIGERRIERLGPDTVVLRLIFPRGERARVDSAGRILGISGLTTSYKWMTERVPDVDIAALTASFASRDAKGAAFGNFSSRDTVRASVREAHVTVDYGRPSKRGRVIFGALVPWEQVWRTGADLATHFTTDRTLRFGDAGAGVVVPPGTYTLYTIPAPGGWTLIVNRQTGQSGLSYDPTADLGRVPMKVSARPDVTERLTISVAPSTTGATLRVTWDAIEAHVPITVVSG